MAKGVCVAISLLGLVVVSACGGASKDRPIGSTTAVGGGRGSVTSSQASPQGQAVKSDGDADNPKDLDGNPDPDTTDQDDDSYTPESRRYPDTDDKATLDYGQLPSPAERQKIAGVVMRYYAAAAAADGATACALIIPSIANSVARDYGSGAGPAYLRGGKTCTEVMAALFKHDRAALAVPPKLLSVRVRGGAAQVVLGSRAMPASLVYLQQQGAAWYMQALLGSPLP